MSAPRPDIDGIFLPDKAVCELCGEPMPAGEEMFQFHGYSGPCPKPPLRAPRPEGMSKEDFRPWLVRQISACDEQMRAAKYQTKRTRFADSALLLRGILQEFDRRQSVEVSPLGEVMTDRFVLDDAKVQAYAKLELSDEAISRGWINWSDTAILACREIARLRADGATLKVRADEAIAAHSASFGALQTLSAALCDGEVDDYAALAEEVIARVRHLESDGATLRERVRKLPNPAYLDDAGWWHCRWCGGAGQFCVETHKDGCLWLDVLAPARAPKEPTP